MKNGTLDKLDKYITFVYVTIKICVRDLYVIPLGYVNKLIILSGVLSLITLMCEIFNVIIFLEFKGVFLAFIIILIAKLMKGK